MVESDEETTETEQKPLWKTVDRKRGIFTQNDREYLLGETELSGQSERNARYRIRERAINSLIDMRLIARLERKDAMQVFCDDRVSSETTHRGAMTAVLLLLGGQYNVDLEELGRGLENLIEESVPVVKMLEERTLDSDERVSLEDYTVSASIDIERDPVMLNDLFVGLEIPDDKDAAKVIAEAIEEKLDNVSVEPSDLISGLGADDNNQ